MKEKGIPLYIVDAFTNKPFAGNPAAVCLLQHKYSDSVLQSIAAEMNLSETAFLLPLEHKPLKKSNYFSLRWFTPKTEVNLCGHATLATAAVLFYEIDVSSDTVNFETKSGVLTAAKEKSQIVLDFPTDTPRPVKPNKALLEAMGITRFEAVEYAEKTWSLLIHVANEKTVRDLKPNFELMKTMSTKEKVGGIIVTSCGRPPHDFISRFFAPWLGINEDPVTGAAHTVLAPYWHKILRKKEMLAYQASARGGEVKVRLQRKDRVDLIGDVVILIRGELCLQKA